jgi:putative Mn2+ efflux pump MntP
MPNQPIDTPDILDAFIAANLRSRRAKLVRAAKNQRMRTRFVCGCSVCVAASALTAKFMAHDAKAAVVLGMIACLTFCFAYIVGKAGQKKLTDSLQQMGAAEQILKSLR